MDIPQGLFNGFIETVSSLAGLRPPEDFQDYDPDELEDVSRPASVKAVESLPTVAGAAAVGEACSVCQEKFSGSDLLKKLPCQHLFHEACVLRWLRSNHTCPLCRFEMEAEPQMEPESCPHAAQHEQMQALRAALVAMNVEPECPCDDCVRNAVCELLSPAFASSAAATFQVPMAARAAEGFSSEGAVVCPVCAVSFRNQEARDSHLANRHFFCRACDIQFDSFNAVRLHQARSEKHWQPVPYKCTGSLTCKVTFRTSTSTSLHRALAHIAPQSSTTENFKFSFRFDGPEVAYDSFFDAMEAKRPICSHCSRIFKDEAAYRRHIALLSPP